MPKGYDLRSTQPRTAKQRTAARQWNPTPFTPADRRRRILPLPVVPPGTSWWLDPVTFYQQAKQEYPRITASKTSYYLKTEIGE